MKIVISRESLIKEKGRNEVALDNQEIENISQESKETIALNIIEIIYGGLNANSETDASI